MAFETLYLQAEDGTPGTGNSTGTQVRDEFNQETSGNVQYLRPHSGTGYVDYGSAAGDSFTYTFDDSDGGDRTIHVRYASNGPRPLDVVLNGVVVNSTSFATTDPDGGGPEEGFNHLVWVAFDVTTVPGENTVVLQIPSGGGNAPNVDAIAVAERGVVVSLYAPEIESGGSFAVDENSTSVGQVEAGDLDGNALSYGLSGADAENVSIDAAGNLALNQAPDFEAPHDDDGDGTFEVTVTVSDGDAEVTQDVTITVNDLPEHPEPAIEPIVLQSETATIPVGAETFHRVQNEPLTQENAANQPLDDLGLRVGYGGTGYTDFGGSGADETISFSITVDEEGAYDLHVRYASTDNTSDLRPLDVLVNGLAQHEAVPFPGASTGGFATWLVRAPVQVVLTEGTNTLTLAVAPGFSNGPNIDAVALTSVGDPGPSFPTANSGPSFEAAPEAITVDEGESGVIGTFDASDADDDALTYGLAGDDAEAFAINDAGELSFVAAPDFEAPGDLGGNNVYDVTVTVTDGVLVEAQAVTVTVADVADEDLPATAITLTAVPVAENVAGAVVADVVVADPDSTYVAADLVLEGPDAGRFELVDGAGGIQLKLLDGEALDFEAAAPSVSVSLGALASDPFSPTVTDVDDPLVVTFDLATLAAYNDAQDQPEDGGSVAVSPDGGALSLHGNLWKRAPLDSDYTITGDTRITVDILLGATLPEIVAVGFDDDDNPFDSTDNSNFQLAGTQGQGNFIDLRGQGVDQGGGVLRFTLDLSAHAGKTIDSLTFIADDDVAGNGLGSVTFSNVSLFEADGEGSGNSAPREVGGGVGDFTVNEGTSIEIDLPFVDDDGDAITFGYTIVDEGGNPVTVEGLVIEDGVLAGPAPAEPGVYTVTLTADDGVDGHVPAESVFILTVSNVNEAPVASDAALEPFFLAAGAEIDGIDIAQFEDFFSDPDGDALTLSAEGLPAGLTLNEEGVIVGTPTVAGDFTVTIRATDPSLASATLTIDLSIDGPQVGDQVVVEAEAFTGLGAATNMQATGQAGASGSQIIRAGNTSGPSAVTTDLSAHGLVEGWYSVAMTRYDETDGSATYSLTVGDTVLADDAAFDAGGAFDNAQPRGNAGQAGNLKTVVFETPVFVTAGTILTFSGQANGELLRTDKFTFTRIEEPDQAPSAPVIGNASVDENADGAVIGTVSSVDPEGTAVSFSVNDARFEVDGDDQLTLRTGESLDHEAGETVAVEVTATDETGKSTTATIEITVNDVNEAPALADGAVLADAEVVTGEGATIDLSVLGAADPDDGDTPTYAISSAAPLPAGFEVVGSDLVVPADAPAGSYEITVFATDGDLDSDSVSFTVTVADAAPFETIILQGEDFALLNPVGDTNPNLIRTETQNWERDGSPLNPEPNATPANPNNEEFNELGLRPDYSGTGYLDIQGSDTGAQASIQFEAPAGTYEVTVRLANGADARPMSFDIDGVPSTIADTTTADWFVWGTRTFTVTLQTGGQHTLTVAQDGTSGAANIDAIAIAVPGTQVDFLPDGSADEDGDFLVAPEVASVDPADLDAVAFRLSGVDADIEIIEVSTDGGASFVEVTAVADGADQIVTLDLTGFAAAETAEIIVRLTDNAGNTVTDSASVAVGDGPIVVEPIVIQAEDDLFVTIDDVGEGGQGEVTREVNPGAPDDFGNYRPGAVGDAYIDFGSNPGDTMTFAVDAPVAGIYTVAFRYANGDGAQLDRPLDLSVNDGQAEPVSFPYNGGAVPWETWTEVTVEIELAQGANTVSLAIPASGVNGPNIDQAVFTYADPASDVSADEDGNLAVTAAATVEPGALDAVEFTLTGVDADIVSYEVSTDGGASFATVTPSAGVAVLDLSAFAGDDSVAVTFRLTDDAGNEIEKVATIAVGEAPEAFLETIQLESRAGDVTIIDDTGGGTNNQNMTQPRDPQNAEPADAEKGPDGLWDGFNGAGYLDMGLNVGDAFSFEIDAPEAGTYTFTFRYANGGATDRPMSVSVGGAAVDQIAFASTTDWDNWVEVSVDLTLEAGVNTISLANTIATGPNLDQVTVSNNVDPSGPDSEPGPRATIKINFQDGSAPKAAGYLVGNFEDYGDQGNGYTYGFVTEASALDADGTANTPTGSSYPAIAINERSGTGTLPNDGSLPQGSLQVDFGGYDPRLTGYAHFDLGTTFPARTAWEIELEDGWYEVTVSVGDTGGANDSANRLFIEGDLATEWTPTSGFKTELVTALAKVEDGHLTLSAQGGTITEMQYLEIRALPDLTPGDGREAPEDYAHFTAPRAVSANGEVALGVAGGVLPDGIDPTSDIVLGINVVDGRGGALLASLSDGSIRLYETLTGIEVPYSANTTGGFDSVTIAPAADLKPFTSYTLVVDGFQDRGDNDDTGAPTREFQKFSTTFVTGEAPVVEAREVAFVDTVELASNPSIGESYTSIEMSPDKALIYVTSLAGTITRWAVDPLTGSLDQSTKEVFAPGGDFDIDGGRRGIIGIAFDPEDPDVIWITDNYPVPLNGRANSVPDFSGRISKVTLGQDGSLEDATISTYLTGLPRSNGDHVTNSLEFRANPDAGQAGEPSYLLYLTQGSNSAMGQPDSAWGLRPERLLNAAILEVDHTRTPPAGGFDVTTEPLPADGNNRRFADSDNDLKNGGIAITSGEFNGSFLHFTEDGVAQVRAGALASSALVEEFYNPFEADAVLRIFAEGNRNAYDLVWHSNGYLYVPTNGSAAGGNVPDDPDTAQNEGINNVGLQSDYLFRMIEGQYYGHPNPLRDKYVLNGGNPTSGTDPNQVGNYPTGTQPDPDYDLEGAYSLQNNKSPNGAIEYLGNAFGSSLQNAVIFTQYSSGDNLRAVLLNPDGTVAQDFILRDTDGNIISYVDPLDVIEGADGRLYMLTLNRANGVSQIIRLDAAPGGEVADTTADAGGDLALLVIDGSDAASMVFQVTGLDPDIETITVSFNGGPAQVVALDAQNRFTANLAGETGEVTATLVVEDEADNTASDTITFTPGTAPETTVIDAIDFTVLSTATGTAATLIRRIDDPSTYETGSTTDGNGDGLNDNYDGIGYLDPNGGAEDKASFTYVAATDGTYSFVFRMANGSGQLRPIAVKTGDQTVDISDTGTGSFATWQDFPVTLTLTQGVNTIVIAQTGAQGAPNVDSVEVSLIEASGPEDGTEVVGGVVYAIYEAENADLDGPVIVSTTDPDGDRNQSGGEFVDFDGTGDQTITWTVSVPEAGSYGVDILYALATTKAARPATLTVNGTAIGILPFAPNSNDGETVWGPQSAEIVLGAGVNTIAITAPLANGANIDYLRVTQEPIDTFDPTFAEIDGEGRIELEATDGTARVVNGSTAEFYFTIDADGTYALDLAANAGAPDGAGVTLFLTADNGLPVEIDDAAFPGTGEAGETTAYVELAAGVAYKLTVVSDQPGASALDYLDVRTAPGDPNADIGIQSQDPTFLDNRLHFSWIDNPTAVVPDTPRDYKESATVEISNTGSAPLEFLEALVTGPFELADPDLFEGLTLAAGQTIEVEVLFDRDAYTSGSSNVSGVYKGALTLRTNDADTPVATVDLAGFWQARDEGGQEPNVNEVWDVFGFGNLIEGLTYAGGGENSVLNFYDVYLPIDETEVLSPYWKLADGVTTAQITQITAFHSPSGATLGIHAPGSVGTGPNFTNHADVQNQTLLPLLGNGNFATATFTNGTIPDGWAGTDIFGIKVAGLSTDPRLNPTGTGAPTQAQLNALYPGYTVVDGVVFDPDGTEVPDGYTVRMFQAVDADGEAIENVFLGIMDYTGINYDYNDNMFVIEGVAPVYYGAVMTLSGLDDAAADDRLVFSRIDNPANGNQAFRDQATITITNDGIGALTIDAIDVNGAFSIVSGPADGTTLAVGASATVTIAFTGTDPADNNQAVSYDGALSISTSAGDRTVALSGLAQIQSEGGEEPTVQQIVEAFGYSTDVAQGELSNGGIVETVGDEVLLPYLQRLDGSRPIEVIQIGAFLSAGVGRLQIHDVTSDALTQLYAQDDNQYQTLLPDGHVAGAGNTGSVARATVDRDEPFGLKVTVDGRPTYSAWTDPDANVADETFNLPASNQGHYIRFFQALDAEGEPIEGTFIGIQDYPGGENFDYNDHVFVIKNVQAYALSAAEDANGDGVNDALVDDDDSDGTPNFFDDDFTTPAGPQTAFNGTETPWAVDGDGLTLMANLFDNGGQGVAYNDGTTAHQGASLRSGEAVDISNGTLAIGYTQPGEWVEYTIDVGQAGIYELTFNGSSPIAGRLLDASFAQGGVVYETTQAAVPDTDAYTTYADTAPQTVTLAAGVQVLRVTFVNDQQDLMSFTLTPIEVTGEQTPFPGPDAAAFANGVLTVDASNYDNGGQGIAYNDAPGLDGGTNGGRVGSDVEQTGAGHIGWIGEGEWLEYTVVVPEAGLYDLDLLLATSEPGRSAAVEFYLPGASSPYASSGTIANPSTGSYTSFQPRSADGIALEAGTQIVRVAFSGGSQDFSGFTLTQVEVNQPPVADGISGVPEAEEGEAYSFDVSDAFSDPDAGDTLTFSASGLPTGLSISSAGVISGTPGADGTFTVTVTASDGTASVQSSFTLTVDPAPVTDGQSPFPGPSAPTFAGGGLTVDASNYDNGGQGIAYNDAAGLQGGSNGGRAGSAVEQTSIGDIGWISNGEWLEYTINVPDAGLYDVDLLLVTNGGAGRTATVSFYQPGAATPYASSGPIANPSAGSWTNYQTRSADGIELQAGVQVVRVTLNGGSQDFRSFTLTAQDEPDAPTQTPYPGPAAPVVGDSATTIDATNFDNGGQGVSWNDNPGKDGGNSFRTDTGVEFVGTQNDIGYVTGGEWLEYTVSVAEAGTYALSLNALTPVGGNLVAVTLADGTPLATFALADSNGGSTGFGGTSFAPTAPIDVELAAGVQTLRFTFGGTPSSEGYLLDFRSFTLTAQEEPSGPAQTPYPGPNAPVIGASALTVDATNFDNGGQGVSWNDDAGKDGGNGFRTDTPVEFVGTQNDIGYIEPGEWLEYTVNVAEAGTYALSLDAKAPIGGNSVAVTLANGTPLATFALADSNGASTSFVGTTFGATAPIEVELAAGVQTLRFTFDGALSSEGYVLDFRSFTLDQVEAPAPFALALALAPEPEPVDDVIGEAGNVTFTQGDADQWFTVSFAEALDDPAVVMGPLSRNGSAPATVRVRNVTDTGFEFQLDEWDYLDGRHASETVSWLAIESGEHTLSNGQMVRAGSTTVAGGAASVAFDGGFAEAPVVLAQVTSVDDPSAVTDRVSSVSAAGFTVGLDEQEANAGVHGAESLAWIALSAGGSTGSGSVAGLTGPSVTRSGSPIDLGGAFGDSFAFLADMQTENGNDPATMRTTSRAQDGVTVMIDEERSADDEVSHAAETVGWATFGTGQILGVDDLV